MKIQLLGAAGEVTGSAYWIQTKKAKVLLDFGMFQGSRKAERQNHLPNEILVKQLDGVILTHAHLDHCGRLPLLTKANYHGPIYATKPTRELADLILRDAAHLQKSDIENINKRRTRAGLKQVEPLYEAKDVDDVLSLFKVVDYQQTVEIGEGIRMRMVDAGHILGSASVELTVEENGTKKTVIFSGDLGPMNAPILRDPVSFNEADLVFMESTYGDRDHRPLNETVTELSQIVQEVVETKGKMFVPVFAVGRAQTLLYCLAAIFRHKVVSPIPIYLDSPMAIKATGIYSQNVEYFDAEAIKLIENDQLRHELETVHFSNTAEDSRRINDCHPPVIVLAGSGMCTGGRILHHFKHNLFNPNVHVLIVGYQGDGSLGRQLVDGKKRVRIFGQPLAVQAKIHTLGGFSAHAGQSELIEWFKPLAKCRPKLVLTHGEDRGRIPLKERMASKFDLQALTPHMKDVIEV